MPARRPGVPRVAIVASRPRPKVLTRSVLALLLLSFDPLPTEDRLDRVWHLRNCLFSPFTFCLMAGHGMALASSQHRDVTCGNLSL
jgi:hypothetical protein